MTPGIFLYCANICVHDAQNVYAMPRKKLYNTGFGDPTFCKLILMVLNEYPPALRWNKVSCLEFSMKNETRAKWTFLK